VSRPALIGPVLIGADEMAGPGPLERVMDALADAFADLTAGRTRSPSRTVIEHGSGRQLVVGPAIWERRGLASVKITTLTPGNPGRGLPLIHGVVVLTDTETGQVTALLDGGELTAVRTGAVAGLATRLCAAPEAADLAVIGAGVQARALVRAMLTVRPIRSVRVFSRGRASAERFAEWVRATAGGPGGPGGLRDPDGPAAPGLPVRVTVSDTVESAVSGAGIICTATSTSGRVPLVAADWVMPGAHLNVIGGTHEDAIEIDPALLAVSFVVVEQRAAALAEAGEVRAALAAGLISTDQMQELGSLVTGSTGSDGTAVRAGRTSVFRGVGMAIEDTAAAAALREALNAAG
jgi:ornithine cyclodeaminase